MGSTRKSRVIRARVEEDTYLAIQRRASDAGYRDMSKWVREAAAAALAVTGGERAIPDAITIDSDAWRQILVELGRWGNNLNQCAASLNRIRKAVVAEFQTGLVARETAERVIAAAKECEATLGEAEAVRDDVLAALDRQRASAVIYLQNSRMPTGGEDA